MALGDLMASFRMKTGCVALVLCLNITVNPPDVIKISPCSRMECWIDPFSLAPQKTLETIGRTLSYQYERWQAKARYKIQLDPTVEEVKKLCNTCREYAKSERSYTQYIPLAISELDSWLKTPSIYVFDCSAAGMIVNAFIELQGCTPTSSSAGTPARDCIVLATCEAHETLPQSVEFPADIFTSCLTTPIKMALRWFCTRSLLHESLDYSLIGRIPGRQTDKKTLLGELNWIFTAVTDTIARNVLPHDLFQRLYKICWLPVYFEISYLQRGLCVLQIALRFRIRCCLLCINIICGMHGIWLQKSVFLSFQDYLRIQMLNSSQVPFSRNS
ncbi:hypothetical protein POM88_047851 [Heracleum sosnowskyi]|uniref:Raptor N-terminal CASPase-like domain-containing protein n=1 Tax=Heracleum sosnowskyi TaxID=360622 RepID=A0AAD8GUY8_9APIA|nr:hypothetical protein POM88_047851 [Heracleum sosnowskyi]